MSAFVSAMRFVGDLDNEFYRDEHQRDVWNEASAVGFQLCLWISAIAMAVLPWVAGSTGAWVAFGLFLVTGVISIVTLAYSKSRRVDVSAQTKPLQPRAVVVALLYIAGVVGFLVQTRSAPATPIEFDLPTVAGAVVGGLIGGGAVALLFYRSRKKQQALDALDDDL
ncbi:DUF2029 domain-containing protein [Actinomycetes bacterium M1A6_2h]